MMRLACFLLWSFPLLGEPLFRDDFSRFPPGVLSSPIGQLNGAIQEYHYLEHRGVPTHPWTNPIVHDDSWAAGDEDGKPYLEQHLIHDAPERFNPLFVTGDPEWSDYTVAVSVRPLSLEQDAGLVFRYRTSRHHYLFALTGGRKVRLGLKLPVEQTFRKLEWRDLGWADFQYSVKRYYRLKVQLEGPRIRCFVDDRLVLEATDSELLKGRAGISANRPARFQDFEVSAAPAAAATLRQRIAAREAELARLRAANPQPKLWKRFDTPRFGAGRNVRFGDLDGDGATDMLIAQNVPKVRGDAFDHISCLTAVTLDGRLLWQQGRPNPRNGLLTNDTPFQIHDLDGDGRNEVVLVRDFRLQVLDGATGREKASAWMPRAAADARERPYELNHGDSLAFVNLSGGAGARQIVVKDRYQWFWVFDRNLKLQWQGSGMTGHYPFPADFDGDGREEFVIGFSLWNHSGTPVWQRDNMFRDHADAISAGNFSGGPKGEIRVYICGSDEGFVVLGRGGNLVKQIRLGHAQTQSVGKYRPEAPGLQILIANFWRNPGIITLLDPDANILAQEEMVPGSTHLAPVNWRGDGQEFALLSANLREGGMIDGQLRRVVMFPADGHPDLACHVLDVTGDARDEIVVWDTGRVWIYTQDRPFSGSRIYKPLRNPHYNDSNYRATVSLPGWQPHSRGGTKP